MADPDRSLLSKLPTATRLLQAFLDRRRRDLAVLQTSLREGDYKTLARLGHSLRGSAPSYGFPELAAIGERLESAALSQSAARAQREVEAFSSWVRDLNAHGPA